MSGGYPPRWEADVVLADGGTVHLRPIAPDDGERLLAFHAGLSPETIRYRFFAAHPTLSAREVEHFTHVDYDGRVAMVAVLGGALIAVARFERVPGTDIAEVAFVVTDAHQGRGLGSVLLEHLAAIAAERYIRRFEAEVLAENTGMARVFRDAGYQVERSQDQDVFHLVFPVEPTAASLAVMQSREHRSEARSVERLLNPRSVAVVGAGRDPAGLGHVVLLNLLRCGFQGPVYPINPNAEYVASVRAYPSVEDVPGDLDLAVLAVPYTAVANVVVQCANKGVHGLVVMSGGYRESGPSGLLGEQALVATARANGMRVIGPNCLGIMNAAPEVRLNATLVPTLPEPGRVGFFTQSGSAGFAILESVAQRGLGFSAFVSAGNRADVSGNDLLQLWEDDPATDVVLLYLDSFGNPRKFARLARRLGRSKPIVAVKSGGSFSARTVQEGATDGALDALFRQAGVIRVDTLSELFDVAAILTSQPLPAGRRVAVVGNSVELGQLATQACVGGELEVGPLSSATHAKLRSTLGPDTVLANPIILPPGSDADALRCTLDAVLADPLIDAVVNVFVPPMRMSAAERARMLSFASGTAAKPVVSAFQAVAGQGGATGPLAPGAVPLLSSPEVAVSALARTAAYAAWRRRPEGTIPHIAGINPDRARGLVHSELTVASPGADLSPDAVADLLSAYGVHVWPAVVAASMEQAAAGAQELGYPVALKATAPSLRHRPELGSVRLDIGSEEELRAAYRVMTARLSGPAAGLIVQAMAAPGIATVIRIEEDPSFGALMSFGLGGIATDLLGDRAFRIVPLTDLDAAELIRSVRAAPLLFGYRGSEPMDVQALEQLLLRVSRLADDLPEVAELELNPVIVSSSGVSVLRASARLDAPTTRPDAGPRRLR